MHTGIQDERMDAIVLGDNYETDNLLAFISSNMCESSGQNAGKAPATISSQAYTQSALSSAFVGHGSLRKAKDKFSPSNDVGF